jgi:hypothetical protein
MLKLMYAGLVCLSLCNSISVLADDSPSAPPVKSAQQQIDECVAKRRAANASLSIDDARKACQREQQLRDNHPSIPPARQDVPQP